MSIEPEIGMGERRTMSIEPEIGMGVTESVGSDKYPWTIVAVSKNKKTIHITSDNFKVVSGSEQLGNVIYEYTPDPTGDVTILTLRRDGRWRATGETKGSSRSYSIGVKRAYMDPSF